jgi:hypothetical protein
MIRMARMGLKFGDADQGRALAAGRPDLLSPALLHSDLADRIQTKITMREMSKSTLLLI